MFLEKSLKAIEVMEKWNSLDRALTSIVNNKNDIIVKISELEIEGVLVPETFIVRKETLLRMITILQKRRAEVKQEYANLLFELDNISEDLMKQPKKESSKR